MYSSTVNADRVLSPHQLSFASPAHPIKPTHGSITRPTSAHIIPTLRRAHQNRRKSPPHSGFATAATAARAAVQRQIPNSPRTLRKCHLHTHRVHPRSPTRNRKRAKPSSRNQHAPRRRARHLRTITTAVPISVRVHANPSSGDSPTINNDNDNDDNNAYSDTRPRPTIPSRATRSPLASARIRIRTDGTYEWTFVLRRSTTRSHTRPHPFARTWIRGEPRTTTTISSSTRAEFHQREGG